jgi:hypothetical protein
MPRAILKGLAINADHQADADRRILLIKSKASQEKDYRQRMEKMDRALYQDDEEVQEDLTETEFPAEKQLPPPLVK